ncbi:MAG TPA: peptidoglycan DD-metalloendopeptidase family protein [Candidatus Acidoferrales bacterium]|nr:peptidoglycan DD-metalloendopeptidase family protein [Candidatus Acidoferrales bacterium]
MARKKIVIWSVIVATGLLVIGASYYARYSVQQRLAHEIVLAQEAAILARKNLIEFTVRRVPRGMPFAALLLQMGVDPATTVQVVLSAQHVFNFRTLHAGNELMLGRSALGQLLMLCYQIDPDHILTVVRRGAQFEATVEAQPIQTETASVEGKIGDSLFDAVAQAGESPELAMRLADIFSWDLDFYTDPRPGDTFRVVVEKKRLKNNQFIGYGKILAAEYVNDGRAYRAVLFHDPAGVPAYYTPDGKSLKKAFLHSPLKFAAVVTSHFSYSRFHPILKVYRPHLGTDYAAPTGTPVQSIGDGRVIFAGRKGGDGNLVKIEHINGYETYYMHLSRILVHPGERVTQGQTIGRVGMTGLATGPHLDFRIERHGQFMNFERLPLPPSQPVARRDMVEFVAVRDKEMALLPPVGTSVASAVAPASSSSRLAGAPAASAPR